MKYLLIFAFLIVANAAIAQYSFEKNDFFEIGLVVKTISNSDYLSKTGDFIPVDLPWDHPINIKGKDGFGVNMKYGKAIASFAHIVFELEYAQYNGESKNAFIYRDKTYGIGDIISFKRLNLSFGPRFKIIGTDGFELSLEGGGKAYHTINAGDDLVAGFYGRAIAGINLNRRVQINVKYGYESTVGKYAASNLPAELAIHFKIY